MKMINTKILVGVNLVLISALVLALFSSVSCNNLGKGYRKFVMNKGTAHFSFEYPVSFEEPITDVAKHGYWPSYITLLVSRKIPKGAEGAAEFGVMVSETSNEYPDAQAELNQFIGIIQSPNSNAIDSDYYDTALLERTTIIVDGINGEMIVWSCKWWPNYYVGPAKDAIMKDIYFDHGGLIWNIEFYSHLDKADQSKIDLDHILQTFKILN